MNNVSRNWLAKIGLTVLAAAALFAPIAAHAACAPAWAAATIYTQGNTASENGINYVANWWTQGNDPATNNGGAGSGQPWTSQGACGGATCTTKPAAPTALNATGTTQTGTTLHWTAPANPANCTVSGYTIYKAGVSIGTSTTTSFTVTGLAASTTYSFTVAATDAAGTGVASSALSVTTSANTCTVKAGTPTGLAASGTTSSSTTLNWSAVTPPSGCSISGYTVYQGGTAKATVSSGTSYTVTGLSASTAYSFTVASVDAAGTSAQSSAVSVTTSAQQAAGPIKNAVIGYWDNWGTFTMPNTSMNYKVINYAFAVGSGTDGATQVMWTPSATNPLSSAKADIAATKAQGRTVILSLGGATSPNITLLNTTDVNNFVSSVENLVDTYGFQGIDLDFENGSVTVNAGDSLTNPQTPDIKNLSTALHTLKSHYGSSFIITYVPETADIDAYAAYSGLWGGYLALIGATRDILTFSDTQCYNSGSMNAANGQVVSAGTADFLVAMSELLLHGYTVSGGQTFAPLAPSQVAFGSLYNGTAASINVSAYKYLTAGTADGGSYHLLGGPYPNMAGVMVWDINGDAGQGYSFSTTLKNGGLTGN